MQQLFATRTAATGRFLLAFSLLLASFSAAFAEGSVDFVNRPGYRLHLVSSPPQQFKVYASAGEFINVGSSNVRLGGTIKVYRPNGTLAETFDKTKALQGFSNLASIDNLAEEIAGPIGNLFDPNTVGYSPGVVPVGANGGVWTVVFGAPDNLAPADSTNFPDLLNNQDWSVDLDQYKSMTIIAWDITVSKNAAANNGGQHLKGRLYSQELSTFIRNAGKTSSPLYYVLTRDGFLYKVELNNLDPVRFWFSSNNVGLVNGAAKEPFYKSILEKDYTISSDFPSWNPASLYHYDPQEPDAALFVNNKVFINPPAADLPLNATTTNVFKPVPTPYSTWLRRTPTSLTAVLGGFTIGGSNGQDTCFSGSIQAGVGGYFHFNSNQSGVAQIFLDIDNNGSFADAVDRQVFGDAVDGANSVFWDGKDGLGNPLPIGNRVIPYKLNIRAGGMHIFFRDVENSGGFSFTLQNTGLGNSDFTSYNFDHSLVAGGVSGGGTPGNPLPQSTPDPYSNFFGEEKLMNYWKYYDLAGALESTITVIITNDCTDQIPDSDHDGVSDNVDLDDDNDGVPDSWEYCNPSGSFACLPNGIDPSGDLDGDKILNFQDKSDPAYPNSCNDANSDGKCDNLPSIFDTDGDGTPDHLDLDSDNDGITDLVEAGHKQTDANGDGVIDGLPAAFGPNGLFDPIDTDPTSFSSTGNYVRWDFDGDGVPDHDDLDSDNDGINDVIEAIVTYPDLNGDGRLDGPFGTTGLADAINPTLTTTPITNPVDTDGDSIPDWHDLDSDGDGLTDVTEGGNADPDGNGIIGTGAVPPVNTDGQATSGTTSNPPNTGGTPVPDFREFDCTTAVPGGIPVLGNASGSGNYCAGQTVVLSAQNTLTSVALPVSYQFLNASGSVIASGNLVATNDLVSFTINNVSTADAGAYSLVMTGASGCPSAPANFNLNVGSTPAAPDLTAANLKICEGDDATISFAPVGSNLTYVWFLNGIPLTTTSDPVLSLQNFSAANVGNYTVAAQIGTCSSPISNAIALGITAAPSNLTAGNSVSGKACENGSATLTLPTVVGATYHWSGPNGFSSADQNPVISPLLTSNSGSYSAVVTVDGCPFNSSATSILVNAQPTNPVISGGTNPICAGTNVVLQTSATGGGASFDWFFNGNFKENTSTPELTLVNVAAANAGDYSVKITGNDCASNNFKLEIVDPGATLVAGSSLAGPVCEGGSATLNIQNVQGATYAWSGPKNFTSADQNPTIDPLNADNSGQYSVVVSLNGCPFEAVPVTLTINPKPATPNLAVAPATLCANGQAILTSTAAAGAVTYEWFLNGNPLPTTTTPELVLSNLTAANAGNYSVQINGGTCVSALSNVQILNITDPGVTLTASNTTTGAVCEGTSATLNLPNVAGATYQWSGPNGYSSNLQNPTISPLTVANSGSYTAVVSLSGCQFPSSPTSLSVVPTPATPVLTVAATSPCAGSTVVLQTGNAGAGVLYNWYFNGQILGTTTSPSYTLQNFSAANTGNYTVVVNAGFCASPVSNTVALGITDPGVLLTASNSLTNGNGCEGGSANLNVQTVAGATYSWTGPGGFSSNLQNPTIAPMTPANSGQYSVVVTLNGCQFPATPTQIVVGALPSQPAISGGVNPPCAGSTAVLQTSTSVPGATFEWFFNGNLLTTTTVPSLTLSNFAAANAGDYSVKIVGSDCFSNVLKLGITDPGATLAATNNASNPLCEGGSVTLNLPTVAGATYLWTGPNGFSSSQQNPTISLVSVANSGSYSAVVSLNGCQFPATATQVNVSATPAAVQISNSGPVCENGSASLTVSNPPAGNITFNWFNAAGMQIGSTTSPTFNLPSPPTAGNYSVQIQAAGGCTSAMSAATSLKVDFLPSEKATVVEDLVINCGSNFATIEAIAPTIGTGQWLAVSPGLTFINPTAAQTTAQLANTTLKIAVWSLSNGACVNYASDTVQIVSETSLGAVDDSYTVEKNGNLTGAVILTNDNLGGASAWTTTITTQPKYGTATLSGDLLNYTPNRDYVGPDELKYTICSKNCPNLCSTATVKLKIGEGFFIPNIITPNDDGKNDGLVITGLEQFPNNRLMVFNRWGDQILDKAPYQNDWKGTWNEEDLPAGTYFILLYPDKAGKEVYSQYLTIIR